MTLLVKSAASACGCRSSGCLCPAAKLARLIGRRHVVTIISLLGNFGLLRFGELRSRLGGLSTSTLAQILADLSRDRLILRAAHAEAPPRVEYSLSREGRELYRVLSLLARRTCGIT